MNSFRDWMTRVDHRRTPEIVRNHGSNGDSHLLFLGPLVLGLHRGYYHVPYEKSGHLEVLWYSPIGLWRAGRGDSRDRHESRQVHPSIRVWRWRLHCSITFWPGMEYAIYPGISKRRPSWETAGRLQRLWWRLGDRWANR